MILCHDPGRETFVNQPKRLPPFKTVIRIHEIMAEVIRPSKIVAVSIAGMGRSRPEIEQSIRTLHDETGLQATDPVLEGPSTLADIVLEALKRN